MFPINSNNLVKINHVSSSTSKPVTQYLTEQLPPVTVFDSDDNLLVIPVNDVYDLFNQDRLSGFSQDVIDAIRSNIQASSPYADQITKLSDSEIFDSIRPRQIQSPSELVQWSKYIQAKLDARISDVLSKQTANDVTIDHPTDNPTKNE